MAVASAFTLWNSREIDLNLQNLLETPFPDIPFAPKKNILHEFPPRGKERKTHL